MNNKSIITFLLACMFLLIPCLDMALWMLVWDGSRSFEANQQDWVSRLPVFLQRGRLINILNVVFLGVSITLFRLSRKQTAFRLVSTILLVITAVLFLWQLFALS